MLDFRATHHPFPNVTAKQSLEATKRAQHIHRTHRIRVRGGGLGQGLTDPKAKPTDPIPDEVGRGQAASLPPGTLARKASRQETGSKVGAAKSTAPPEALPSPVGVVETQHTDWAPPAP